jgi:phosphatidylglycerol:prolipoprotein diacylglycerol transferase
MFPVIAEFGPFTLYSLWIFVSAGFITATLMFLKRAKYKRMEVNFIVDNSLSLLVSAMIFSRIGFFLTSWGYFGPLNLTVALKQIFFFWQPGYSFWGGIIGFMIMLVYLCKRKKQKLMDWLEIMIVPFFTGMIIGNIGQFLDGQAYGHDTILPWGITFTSTNVKYTVPIHPTQIYSIILILLILLSRKKLMQKWKVLKNDPEWTLFAITVYAFARFWLEFLRGDDTLQWGIIRLGHVMSLIVFVGMMILLYKKWRPAKKH